MNSDRSTSGKAGTRRGPEQFDAKELAFARRDALLERARRIRRSVASLAALLFVTAFLVIYVQLASGHDPALVADTKRAAAASTHTTSGSPSNSSGTGSRASSESSGESSVSSSEESSSGASVVTTSQS